MKNAQVAVYLHANGAFVRTIDRIEGDTVHRLSTQSDPLAGCRGLCSCCEQRQVQVHPGHTGMGSGPILMLMETERRTRPTRARGNRGLTTSGRPCRP